MPKLNISIGASLNGEFDVSDDKQYELFRELSNKLNVKVNELSVKIGKINGHLLLFAVFLIYYNRKKNIFDNFEEQIVELLKSMLMYFPPIKDINNPNPELIRQSLIFENNLLKDDNDILMSPKVVKKQGTNEKDIDEIFKKVKEMLSNFANEIDKL